ncbi:MULTISPECIES: hypothetical protein [Streptomyces]|uniref:Uncharacterized protein n=1 Tax=Streptomyces fimbriatus TaxID=68197 RepID=A0ABW0DD33_STRFI
MWFFEALASGFTHPTDPGRLQWFRIVFGTVLTARFALTLGQGGWDRLATGSLSPHVAEQRFGPRGARLLASVYRPVLIVRTVAALALALGLVPRLALLTVLAGAAMELLYLRSPNAVRYTPADRNRPAARRGCRPRPRRRTRRTPRRSASSC